MINEVKITRRSAVGKLGTLLAAGLWPGVLKANSSNRKYVPIRFSVLNDFHHENEQCDHWFTELFRSAGGHGGVSFIAGLGDLANKGKKESISAIKRISIEGKVPFYTVPGNHDNDLEGTTNVYSSILPDRLNYFWIVNDWQCIALDSTDSNKYNNTVIGVHTLDWLSKIRTKLDPLKPTVIFTHFPIGSGIKYRPLNAESVLELLVDFNLRGTFSGHYHSQTKATLRDFDLVTNVCCSRVSKNHDGTLVKGYYVCDGLENGNIIRKFIPFSV
jgi:calcineurin-like phosphoesterase family protein